MRTDRYLPPAWLESIIARAIPAASRDFFLGDLSEEYCDMIDSRGRLPANVWYSRQMASTVGVAVLRHLRNVLGSPQGPQRTKPRLPVNGIGSDVRGAFRTFLRRPGFTLVALGTIGLGIGANTAIFSVIDGIALRPLPYDHSDELFVIWPGRTFTKEMVAEFEEQTALWETVAGYAGWGFTITGIDNPATINGAQVSADYFSMLRETAAIGRVLVRDDGLPEADPVVVLSHELWASVFQSDSTIIGRTIQMGGADYDTRTVVGVMPADYRDLRTDAEAWVPFLMDPADPDYPQSWYVRLLGRVSEGAEPELVQAELGRFADTARVKRPDQISDEEVATATTIPLKEFLVGDIRSMMLLLGAAVGFVLLIACANIANLLLALSATREKEFAVRNALGAARSRIARQILIESVVLGSAGGVLGLVVGYVGLDLFKARAGADLSLIQHVSIDMRVIVFAFVTTLVCSVLFGLLPALRSSGRDIAESLRSEQRTSSKSGLGRMSTGLISVEVALAAVLAIGAGLMLRSFAALTNVEPGFNTSAISIDLGLPPSAFEDRNQQRQFFRDLTERLAATPGIQAAGTVHLLPMTNSNWSFPMYPQGIDVPEGTPPPVANFRVIGPGYFEAMQIPVIRGRDIAASDRADGEQVGLVNRALAGRYWPGEDPVGKRINLFSSGGPAFTIVGVVGNIKQHSLEAETVPEMYRPYEQWTIGRSYLVARGDGRPETLIPTIREVVREINPDVPLSDIRTLDQVLSRSTAESQYVAELTFLFAAIALAMGAIGVYGVTSYVVGRRTREIGVRMALGATTSEVMREVLIDSARPVVAGLALGLAAALGLGRLVESLLFGVAATDGTAFGLAALAVVFAGLGASAVPARRASRVDPNEALRAE